MLQRLFQNPESTVEQIVMKGKFVVIIYNIFCGRSSVMVTANLMRELAKKSFHGVIHCGDIAYADKWKGERQYWEKQVTIWDFLISSQSSKSLHFFFYSTISSIFRKSGIPGVI